LLTPPNPDEKIDQRIEKLIDKNRHKSDVRLDMRGIESIGLKENRD